VAFVVVRYGRGTALLERQSGLGPVECLELGFFIDTKHHGPIRRVKVKPDDIRDLLLELRVV
jgi:hypothetical protein